MNHLVTIPVMERLYIGDWDIQTGAAKEEANQNIRISTTATALIGSAAIPWVQRDGDAFYCVPDGHEVLGDGLGRRRQGAGDS